MSGERTAARAALTPSLFALLAGLPAAAQDFPRLTVETELSVQAERVVGGSSARKVSDVFAEIEAGIGFFLTEELSLQARLKFEPVRTSERSRYFEDEGLFAEELFVNFERDGLALFGGKFNPAFGTAWDRLSELFQRGFAEDYERTEAIGVGASYTVETARFGTHEVGAALFHGDNTLLSNSVFARPRFAAEDTGRVRRTRQSQGGPANTHDFTSYTLTLNGGELPGLGDLNYHLGHSRLARGVSEAWPEHGYVAALHWPVALAPDLVLTPLVELAWFRHLGGGADHARYLTTALMLDWGAWQAVAVRTGRRIDEPADGSGAFGYDYTDSLLSLLLAYRFDFGLTAQAGWKREQVEGAPLVRALGARLTYEIHF